MLQISPLSPPPVTKEGEKPVTEQKPDQKPVVKCFDYEAEPRSRDPYGYD